MLTTVILPPGVGNPGSVLPGLTPFPLDPLDPLDPVESSSELRDAIFYAQALWLSNIISENGVLGSRFEGVW